MSWQEQGLCWQSEAPDFFPSHGQHDEAAKAKAVCAECPVTDECLEYALVSFPSQHYDFGVWGGTSPPERHELRKARTNAGVRTCKRCLKEKSLDEFPRSGSGYRRYDCRTCWSLVTSPRRGHVTLVKVHTEPKHLDEAV